MQLPKTVIFGTLISKDDITEKRKINSTFQIKVSKKKYKNDNKKRSHFKFLYIHKRKYKRICLSNKPRFTCYSK